MNLTLSFQDYFLRLNRNLITVDDFTEYLSVFQEIIYIIAGEQGYKRNIQDFRFLIKKIKLESFECVIESYGVSKDLLGEDPVEKVINEFKEISELIDIQEREETFVKLKEKIKEPKNRISLYNYFDRIVPKENKAFQIYTKEKTDPESERIFLSKRRYKKNIDAWRQLDKKIKPETASFIGIIKSLNAYNINKKFIKIIDESGNKIQYFYDEQEKERFTKLYDRDIIKISGEYDPYQKSITNLTMFEKIRSTELSKLKNLKFKHPVKFDLEYEHSSIYGINKEFDLYAMGSNYNEMLQDLYNRIRSTIELYSNPQIKFTNSSEEYRKKFLETFS
ncbi:MAG: hypothetical protein ACFFG0_48670 [Candidatus Thorarchaeota archaeon]